jgi:drug/metabolite transporter (DMT)-like permease
MRAILQAWTIRRATGIGVTAGIAALILWPVYAAYQERVLWAFVAALAVAAFCGLSILFITAVDMLLRRRSESLRPVRAFDVVLGLGLALPSLIQLRALLSL